MKGSCSCTLSSLDSLHGLCGLPTSIKPTYFHATLSWTCFFLRRFSSASPIFFLNTSYCFRVCFTASFNKSNYCTNECNLIGVEVKMNPNNPVHIPVQIVRTYTNSLFNLIT